MNANARATGRLEAYEAAACASRSLLRAALEGDWGEFDRLQGICRAIVDDLRQREPLESLPAGPARRRQEILGAILADDRRIRDLLEPTPRRLDLRLFPGPSSSHPDHP